MRHLRVESLGPMEDIKKSHTKSEAILSQMFKLPKVSQGTRSPILQNPNWFHQNYTQDQTKTNSSSNFQELQDKLQCQIAFSYPQLQQNIRQFLGQVQLGITLQELQKNNQQQQEYISILSSAFLIMLALIKEKEPKKLESQIVDSEISRKFSLAQQKEINQKQDRQTQLVNNELRLINHKLQNELNQLATKLKNLEISQNVDLLNNRIFSLQEEIKQLTSQFKFQIDEKDSQLIKNLQKIAQLGSIIQTNQEKINSLETYIADNQERFTMMNNTYMSVFNERHYWKDMAMMLQEDLLGQHMKHQRFLLEEAKSKKKLMMLQRELDQIKIEKSKRVEIPEYNKDQEERLQKLIYLFTKEKFHIVQMKSFIEQKLSKLNEQEQIQYQFMKNLKLDYVYVDKLNKYTYPRQSFLVFFESQIKLVEAEYKNINRHKISLNYFGQIRSILDAKFNEFQYVDNLQTVTKFADFVFSWISTFGFERHNKNIVQLTEQIENVQLDFLLDTLNPKLGKIHEIITFNEFLFEQSSLDEVYYYLHCRYMLFKGHLTNQSRSKYETIIFIKFEEAEHVVQQVMQKYTQEQISITITTISEFIIIKNKLKLIDGHYVLRILLELYRSERQTRLSVLQEMFHSCLSLQSFGKYGVNYKNFRKIFQFNFPSSSEVEICSLFREAHMCGDGAVTAESFFTAATEANFFIKQLQLSNLHNPPLVEYYKISYCEFNLPYLDFYVHYKQIPKELIYNQCIQMGMEYVNYELDKLYQVIDSLFSHPNNIYTLMQAITKLMNIFNKIQMVKNLQCQEQNWQSVELEGIRQLVNQIPGVFGLLIEQDTQEKLQQISKSQKIRALQLVGKRKALKFYSLISAMLNAKVKDQGANDKPHEQREVQSPTKKGMRKSGRF